MKKALLIFSIVLLLIVSGCAEKTETKKTRSVGDFEPGVGERFVERYFKEDGVFVEQGLNRFPDSNVILIGLNSSDQEYMNKSISNEALVLFEAKRGCKGSENAPNIFKNVSLQYPEKNFLYTDLVFYFEEDPRKLFYVEFTEDKNLDQLNTRYGILEKPVRFAGTVVLFRQGKEVKRIERSGKTEQNFLEFLSD